MVSRLPTEYSQEIPSALGPAAAPSSIIYTTSIGPDGRAIYHLFKGVPARYETPGGPVYGTQWVRGEGTYTIPLGAQPVNDFTAPWTQGNPGASAQNDWAHDRAWTGAGNREGVTHEHQQGPPPPGYPAYPFTNSPFPTDPYAAPLVYPPGHVKAGQPIPELRAPSSFPGAYPWMGSPFGAYPPYPTAPTPGGQPISHSPAPGLGSMSSEIACYAGYSPRPSVYPSGHVKEGQPMPQSRAPSPNPGAYPWTGYSSGTYPSTPAAATPGGWPTSHSPAAGGSSIGYGIPGYAGPSPAPLVYPPGHVKEGQPIPYSRPPSPVYSEHPPTRPLSGSYFSNTDLGSNQGPPYPHYAGSGTSYPPTPYSGYDNQPGPSRSASGHLQSSSYSRDSNHRSRENDYSDLHRQFGGLNLRPEDVSNAPYGRPDSNYSRPPTRGPSRSSLPRSNTSFTGAGSTASLVYPPGHVKEGQPVPRPRTPSPLPDLFGEPPFRRYPSSPAAPVHGGPSPSMSEPMTVPREPAAQLVAPEGFSRSVNHSYPFTPFYIMKVQDMEYFWERIPRMPEVLVDHNVLDGDWDRLMEDMALAWAGKLPTIGSPQLRSELIKDLVDTWNTLFFFKRGVEVVLYQGKRRCSGPHAGLFERDLPDHEDPLDYQSSVSDEDSEESDDLAHGYTGRGDTRSYSIGQSSLRDVFEEGRLRGQADKARKRREQNRRRREKYREKKYSLYLAYVPMGAAPEQGHGTRDRF